MAERLSDSFAGMRPLPSKEGQLRKLALFPSQPRLAPRPSLTRAIS